MSNNESVSPKAMSITVAIVAEFLTDLVAETGDVDMTIPQALLLIHLKVNGGIYQQNLEKFTKVKKSANSRNIAKLGPGEKPLLKPGPGYVMSEDDLHDRRQKIVSLTPTGKALIDKVSRGAARLVPQ